jgi:hypothetical protein
VFLAGTTCKDLVHKLGRKGSRTTKELLDIATNFSSGEEAVGAIFSPLKAKGKQQEDTDKGGSSHNSKKKKKNKQQLGDNLMAVVERKNNQPHPRVPQAFLMRCLRSHAHTIEA